MAEDAYNIVKLRIASPFELSKAVWDKKVLEGELRSMRDEMMMAIARNDPSKINAAFIISNFSEDYFKEMIDEYLSKVMVCGKTPNDPQKQ